MDEYFAAYDDFEGIPEGADLEALRQMYDGDVGGYYDDEGNFIPVVAPRSELPAAPRPPLEQLVTTCVVPSVESTAGSLVPLLALCLLCTVAVRLGRLRPLLAHSVHASAGVAAGQLFFGSLCALPAAYCCGSYALLLVARLEGRRGPCLAAATAAFVVLCELLVPAEAWHAIRGAQMVLSMKAISLAFDLDKRDGDGSSTSGGARGGDQDGAEDGDVTAWRYAGYALSPGTAIFGPWLSFSCYVDCVEGDGRTLNGSWLRGVATRLPLAVLCLVTSTCFGRWVFNDDRYVWLSAYRDAQSFRFSHYFVSYLAELAAMLAGLGVYGGGSSGAFVESIAVARPSRIELPRSLVEVVAGWNLPMHRWLKAYVFAPSRQALGSGAAVLLTYAASSLLHGVNFQLAAVLLSLGLYSYVEHVLRRALAAGFSACVEARTCKPAASAASAASGRCACAAKHRYGARHPAVVAVNVGFGLLAAFHLAYLGVMFDTGDEQEKGYNMKHTLSKWSALGFASHYVVVATYAFYWLIK